MINTYACDCGETCTEEELLTVCTFQQTHLEPAEYQACCPGCGTDFESMTEVAA